MWGPRADWLCWSGLGRVEHSFFLTQVSTAPDECERTVFVAVNIDVGDSLELACPSSPGSFSD